ncbi:MAG TPA: ATP synthase subunit I [Bacillota bacterium]|nr:ATP synthase subunit I [Bacillota bacterium]
MLKRVMICDGIIMLLSFIVSMIFFREFVIAIVVGVAVAFFNYLMNSAMTGHAMNTSRGMIWILLGAVVRIAIACGFAFILYNDNLYNIIAYITGYSLHYVSIIISASQRGQMKREGE